jgi:hypothetical protein
MNTKNKTSKGRGSVSAKSPVETKYVPLKRMLLKKPQEGTMTFKVVSVNEHGTFRLEVTDWDVKGIPAFSAKVAKNGAIWASTTDLKIKGGLVEVSQAMEAKAKLF